MSEEIINEEVVEAIEDLNELVQQEQKKSKKNKKEEKKAQKKEDKKQRREIIAMIEEQFELIPEVELSKKEKAALQCVGCLEGSCFFELCDCLDIKPSKLDEVLSSLVEKGLIDFSFDEETLDTYLLTENGRKYINSTKAVRKSEKKFREFLSALSAKELKEFFELSNSYFKQEEE